MAAAWQVTLAETAIGTAVQVATGDIEALVHEHSRLVFRVAYSVLRNHADAEDAVQETFLRALRHRHKLAGIADPKAWLARIAWRIAIDRRPKSPLLDEKEVSRRLDSLASPEAAADERLARAEMSAILDALIPTLPEPLREVLLLSTVEEMASAGISAVLGIPDASVRTRLLRARQLLREKVSALMEGRR